MITFSHCDKRQKNNQHNLYFYLLLTAMNNNLVGTRLLDILIFVLYKDTSTSINTKITNHCERVRTKIYTSSNYICQIIVHN